MNLMCVSAPTELGFGTNLLSKVRLINELNPPTVVAGDGVKVINEASQSQD
jgi:hypothetical protein